MKHLLRTLFWVPAVCVAQDWKGLEVPANAGEGKSWVLQATSDSFDYAIGPVGELEEFDKRWDRSFINRWTGPSMTEWNAGHSYATNGHLGIASSRKKGEKVVYTGIVTSKESFTYPVYVEARAKLSKQVLASCVWMLSDDSTEEIDIIEAYGSDRPDQKWTAERLHLSHHVFIRKPFQDYQPTDEGSWFAREGTIWADDFHRVGVYWRDPWHLEYYVDGKLARTVSGKDIIDPRGYTNGKGLTKAMKIIINQEDQQWRYDQGITPTDEELANVEKSIFWVDWIRVYKPEAKKE
ncbi:family 16 glycosylhydrolase [Roseibacillus persicicus]|uniref:family 16 glycosylhydrolase n=2 Tax=Roseibacillus persicicus TaxID=454148 RepID=UPI00280C79CB|nr:family 16 glycosylhydrolase [Roseibacillus persicicus]MDQ8190999.1 family 16 glycosylhydrolase [Roseibacillus persicicus]